MATFHDYYDEEKGGAEERIAKAAEALIIEQYSAPLDQLRAQYINTAVVAATLRQIAKLGGEDFSQYDKEIEIAAFLNAMGVCAASASSPAANDD